MAFRGHPKKSNIDPAGYTDPPQICYMVAESLRDLPSVIVTYTEEWKVWQQSFKRGVTNHDGFPKQKHMVQDLRISSRSLCPSVRYPCISEAGILSTALKDLEDIYEGTGPAQGLLLEFDSHSLMDYSTPSRTHFCRHIFYVYYKGIMLRLAVMFSGKVVSNTKHELHEVTNGLEGLL